MAAGFPAASPEPPVSPRARLWRAVRQLALRFDCSTSQAIRPAILIGRDPVFGVPVETRRQRTRALLCWIEFSEGMDPGAEVHRIQSEEGGFPAERAVARKEGDFSDIPGRTLEGVR